MLPKMKMGTSVIDLGLPPSDAESVIDLRLPQDLIAEILLYLPVKSLVKFKCVSKPWLSLISSSKFIKSHFAASSREGQYSNHHLLITIPKSGMKHCSLSAAFINPCTNVSDIESPSRNPEALLAIVGIVNGLVCLAVGVKDLYLWNPVLKKSKHLPSSNFSWKVFKYLGFGYNDSNDDYKVVKAQCDRCLYPSGGDNGTKVEVYSLLTDSWRRIEDFKGEVPWGNGTYANGKIWWAVTRVSASGGNWKMVSLDMSSDKYEEVQGPVYEAGADNWEVTELGGRLYVLCQNLKIKGDLWVMDKFGVEESWSKVVSISYDDVHPAKLLDMNHVLCISRNGEIVLEDYMSGLLVYSSKDKEFRKVQLGGLRWFYQVFVYAESLVSPNSL